MVLILHGFSNFAPRFDSLMYCYLFCCFDGDYFVKHVFKRLWHNRAVAFRKSAEVRCFLSFKLHYGSHLSFCAMLQNRAGLRHFLDSFCGIDQSIMGGNLASQDSTFGSLNNERQDNKPKPDVKLSQLASGVDSSSCIQGTETRLVDLLDCTLWNRRLAPSSERIVHALVQQIFHGIREYFLVSAELKVCTLFTSLFFFYNGTWFPDCYLLLLPIGGSKLFPSSLCSPLSFAVQLFSSNASCGQVACASSWGLGVCFWERIG